MSTAVIAAAGSGERLGTELPKALVEVADAPLIEYSLRACAAAERIDRVVVAAPKGFESRVEVVAREAAPHMPLSVVTGGATRSESVWLALALLEGATEVVVHDAARPLARAELFDLCVAELGRLGCDGVVPAVPVTDTIKRARANGRVIETLDRSGLWAVQTPQVFRSQVLVRALASADDRAHATDEAMLVEKGGGDVRMVEAPASNIKITRATDLALAELLLRDAD
jgi:2-C-methyl-D-erythritol 4-phosphate cytidylyltransferase